MIPKCAFLVFLMAAATRLVTEAGFVDEEDMMKWTDFDDGDMHPLFSEDIVDEDGLAEIGGIIYDDDGHGGQRMKIVWKEEAYDDTRTQRGHEVKHQLESNKEVFVGYIMHVPGPMTGSDDEETASGSADGGGDPIYFPDDKNTIVFQLYNWNSGGCSNWSAHMQIENNKLVLHYRGACVEAETAVVINDVPRDQDLEFIIRAKAGRGDAEFDVFINGKQEFELRDANFGFGEFNEDGTMETSVVGVKMGMYCSDVDGYSEGEIRTLFYDNMGSAINVGMEEGLELINPEY